jgi:hypothetical protein
MSATPEQYREVFKSGAGPDVLTDLIGWIERRPESERVGGYAVISRIVKMTSVSAVPRPPRAIRAAAGRIAHG